MLTARCGTGTSCPWGTTPVAEENGPEGALRRATGLDRDAWFALLDASGAERRSHAEIAAWITAVHGVSKWWAQTLTVEYEHARGRRPSRGNGRGAHAVSLTTTIEVPVERLFQAFVHEPLRHHWLPDTRMRARKVQPGQSVRFEWGDGATRVLVGFMARGTARSRVALLHDGLPHAAAALELKAFWRERLAALVALLAD
jgi:uncharacterized protein YndB with AHSA1/START domain